jgi:5-formyltetrahydrofolate cyclo-ligase
MKTSLRKDLRRRLAEIAPEACAARSERACRRLAGLDIFRRARTVMIFCSMHGEIDTTTLAEAAWADAKTVLAPKVARRGRWMIPVRCDSLSEGVAPGVFGIREPLGHEAWPLDEIDLVVAPALAYDRRGHRLGRGGGYYDRFLASPELHAETCGLAFAEQIVDRLPAEAHDRPVQVVVTDREVLRFAPHAEHGRLEETS